MKKVVAIIFYGLVKNLNDVYSSFQQNIYNVLKKKYEIIIVIHSFKTPRYSNFRTQEKRAFLATDSYRLLNPDIVRIEALGAVKQSLPIKLYMKHGNPWKANDNKDNQSVANYVLSTYSRHCTVSLLKRCKKKIHYYMFLRPDILFLTGFQENWLAKLHGISCLVPDFHENGGTNDRFIVLSRKAYERYRHIYNSYFEYAQHFSPHAETFLMDFLNRNHITIHKVPFFFRRVRAGGRVVDDDVQLLFSCAKHINYE